MTRALLLPTHKSPGFTPCTFLPPHTDRLKPRSDETESCPLHPPSEQLNSDPGVRQDRPANRRLVHWGVQRCGATSPLYGGASASERASWAMMCCVRTERVVWRPSPGGRGGRGALSRIRRSRHEAPLDLFSLRLGTLLLPGTIFAYGQTGTGKTHTMEGKEEPPELRRGAARAAPLAAVASTGLVRKGNTASTHATARMKPQRHHPKHLQPHLHGHPEHPGDAVPRACPKTSPAPPRRLTSRFRKTRQERRFLRVLLPTTPGVRFVSGAVQ